MVSTSITAVLALALSALGLPAEQKAILWQQPAPITLDDWIWGPGGEARAPKPPFEFVEEDLQGTNAKIRVHDANGAKWTVKFGEENHSEVFVSRLLRALGFVTVPVYFVRSGVISGAHGLRRAKPFVGRNGEF